MRECRQYTLDDSSVAEMLGVAARVSIDGQSASLIPLREHIVVRPDDVNKHSSGIVILQSRQGINASQEQLGRTGTVVAVGDGRKWRNSHRSNGDRNMRYTYAVDHGALGVVPGDRVLFGEWLYPKIDDCIVLSENDIIGVIEPEQDDRISIDEFERRVGATTPAERAKLDEAFYRAIIDSDAQ